MMQWLGIPLTVMHVEVDETPRPGEAPAALAVRLAAEKARAATVDGWVLTADTVVDLDGEMLDKPAGAGEARRTLARLRGRRHLVHTAVALAPPGGGPPGGGPPFVRRVTTEVRMRDYSDAEIEAYVAGGDPLDKAGAYAIQHPGFHPVDLVRVCYANVVGLPLCAVVALLESAHGHIADLAFPIRNVPALCLRHFGYACPGPDCGEALA